MIYFKDSYQRIRRHLSQNAVLDSWLDLLISVEGLEICPNQLKASKMILIILKTSRIFAKFYKILQMNSVRFFTKDVFESRLVLLISVEGFYIVQKLRINHLFLKTCRSICYILQIRINVFREIRHKCSS